MRRAPTAVWECIEPVVTGMGYRFVGAQYASQGGSGLLRVYIDTEDGVTIDDCASVSRQLSATLDVEDPIVEAYVLEVSSPGIDRPLFETADFEACQGEMLKVKLSQELKGRRNFKGLLKQVDDTHIRVQVDQDDWDLPLQDIEEARLVPQFD